MVSIIFLREGQYFVFNRDLHPGLLPRWRYTRGTSRTCTFSRGWQQTETKHVPLAMGVFLRAYCGTPTTSGACES